VNLRGNSPRLVHNLRRKEFGRTLRTFADSPPAVNRVFVRLHYISNEMALESPVIKVQERAEWHGKSRHAKITWSRGCHVRIPACVNSGDAGISCGSGGATEPRSSTIGSRPSVRVLCTGVGLSLKDNMLRANTQMSRNQARAGTTHQRTLSVDLQAGTNPRAQWRAPC
jgi:hypothetical protein